MEPIHDDQIPKRQEPKAQTRESQTAIIVITILVAVAAIIGYFEVKEMIARQKAEDAAMQAWKDKYHYIYKD